MNLYNAAPRLPDLPRFSKLGELECEEFGAMISGLPGFPGRSLKICLKQLVWALARAIVPESRTVPFWHREWLEKAHSLYVFML